MRLLFAEDDAALAATVARGLRENAYAVDVAADGDAAMMQAVLNGYDALILTRECPSATDSPSAATCAREASPFPF
jgi:Response regulators consisting of a CheY-like receiver domain and a winged-helix DNA-binding domain